MLVHPRRQTALRPFRDSQLYSEVLLSCLNLESQHRLEALIQNAKVDHFGVASDCMGPSRTRGRPDHQGLTKRLKLSNDEQKRADHAIKYSVAGV